MAARGKSKVYYDPAKKQNPIVWPHILQCDPKHDPKHSDMIRSISKTASFVYRES